MDAACPKCQLPVDHGAWHCDGCGYEFSQDYEAVRATLQAHVVRARRTLLVTIIVDVLLVGAVVFAATLGFFYISIPLALMVFGSIGHALHTRTVMNEHLASFNRRRPPLPVATVHQG